MGEAQIYNHRHFTQQSYFKYKMGLTEITESHVCQMFAKLEGTETIKKFSKSKLPAHHQAVAKALNDFAAGKGVGANVTAVHQKITGTTEADLAAVAGALVDVLGGDAAWKAALGGVTLAALGFP